MPIGVTGAIIGAGVLGAGASLLGSSQAADAQTTAANNANATQLAMFNKTQSNLSPYINSGISAGNSLMDLTGTGNGTVGTAPLTRPYPDWNPTQAGLEATPGYKFTLDQGLKSVQNSYAAKGLSGSGAALKGGADYATGLASSTYDRQLQNYLSLRGASMATQQQVYNMLMGQQQLGENAAAGQGGISAQVGNSIGQNTIGAGNAQGAASIAGLSGVANAGNNAANLYLQNNLLSQFMGQGGGGGSSGSYLNPNMIGGGGYVSPFG